MIPEKSPPHRRILHKVDHETGGHERITAVRVYYLVLCRGQFCVRRRTKSGDDRHVEKLVYTRAKDAHNVADRLNKRFNTGDFAVFLVKELYRHHLSTMQAHNANREAWRYQQHKDAIERRRALRKLMMTPYWRIY